MSNRVAAPATASASDELAQLRAELAQEEAKLVAMEEGVEMKAAQLSYLNAEYMVNLSRVRNFYEPKLRPLRAVTFAAEEKQKFIEMQIAWLERKAMLQDKCTTENGFFLESRDMRPAAEELMKAARQSLLRAYAEIQNCPTDALRVLVNYENPPDLALETVFLVLQLRGEADMNGPILADSDGATASVQPAAAPQPDKPAADAEEKGETREKILWAASASWPHAKVLATHNYFTNFFEPRSEGMLKAKEVLEPTLMLALEAFCEDPDHTVASLLACSTPIGCLGRWLHAVRDIYRIRMMTAPVLLRAGENTTAEGVRRVQHTLAQITFGRHAVPPLPHAPAAAVDETSEKEAAAPADAEVAEASADSKTALSEAPASSSSILAPSQSNGKAAAKSSSAIVEGEEADLLEKYRSTKRRLEELSRPSVATQDAIYRLRHRLRQLDESCHDAREAVAHVEADMAAKLAEVRDNYDDSMLPLHEQLETQTKAFITVLTGEEMP